MGPTAWPLLNTAIGLSAAFALGVAIGLERQFRQRTAGLRTNVLVAVGATQPSFPRQPMQKS